MKEDLKRGHVATSCHMCRGTHLELVIDLGFHPHSDEFPRVEQLNDFEATYPLRLIRCLDCGLLQIDYFVNPKILYGGEYLYQSSTTNTGRQHYREMAANIKDRFGIQDGELAIDIGSNVGVLLGGFKEVGMRVLGVDPAPMIVEIANKNGIETLHEFFGLDVACRISKEYGTAAVVTGTNVFAHLHDLDDAVEGMKVILDEKGVIVIEAPHAMSLIDNLEYDTIYHQHIGYLSVKPMQAYFNRMGLELFDVEPNGMHGGTLRYYVGFPGVHPVAESVGSVLKEEIESGLYTKERLRRFANDVLEQKYALIEQILKLRREGKRVVALSAPAKGNTLLNYCHLDSAFLDYATERNPLKVGRFTPGMHLPIYPDEKILEDKPDYCLILAWNFAYEIMSNMSEYKKSGGKFIIPIPKPHIV